MMTKPAPGRWTQKLRLWHRLPSASVLPVPSTAHQLLMRCRALLIQLLHNGWRYQEQSAIGQQSCWRMTHRGGFYRLACVGTIS